MRQQTVCLLLGGPNRVIAVGGRDYAFEDHHYCGPTVLGKRGEILDRQPGERHPFWRAVTLWAEQGKQLGADGRCVWAEPPPDRVIELGPRSGLEIPARVSDAEVPAWWEAKCADLRIPHTPITCAPDGCTWKLGVLQ